VRKRKKGGEKKGSTSLEQFRDSNDIQRHPNRVNSQDRLRKSAKYSGYYILEDGIERGKVKISSGSIWITLLEDQEAVVFREYCGKDFNIF